MKNLNPIPDEKQLAPYLIVKDAAKAIDFYASAFGAKEVFRLTDPGSGKIGHAELEFGTARFMLADEYPDFGALSPVTVGGSPVAIHLYVADVDKIVKQAVDAGGTLLRPVKDEFFGDRAGMLTDPFGHKWHLASRKEVVTPEEMQKRWSEMFK
jgi:PhnB protein